METAAIKKTKTIREKLTNLIDGFDEERLSHLYEFLKPKAAVDDVSEDAEEDTSAYYTDEFVAELDRRWDDYKNGGKTYTEEEMNARTNAFLMNLRSAK